MNFNLNPALLTISVRPVAALDFLTRSNYHSAIVFLGAEQLLAGESTGRLISNGSVSGGRVIVIGREPILDIKGGLPPGLTLYGRPGATYSLLSNTNLATSSWTEFMRFVLINRFLITTPTNTSAPATFYRALELKAEPPALSLRQVGGPVFNLQLSGWPGVLYGLETATQLNFGTAWSPLTQFTMTNTTQIVPWTNTGEPERFFRGTVP